MPSVIPGDKEPCKTPGQRPQVPEKLDSGVEVEVGRQRGSLGRPQRPLQADGL